MLRWWVIPKNRFFNIYLHKILRDDDDRALHDHPWGSCSIILQGGYFEVVPVAPHFFPDIDDRVIWKARRRWNIILRRARAAHRLELFTETAYWDGQKSHYTRKPCWSLFITGWKSREWGFYCPKGWVHWRDFVAETDTGNIGRGCE